MNASRWSLLAAFFALAAAACTGGVQVVQPEDNGSAAASSTEPPTTAPPTTVSPTTAPPTTVPPTTVPPTTAPPDAVELLIASMTPEQKVGQLLMPVLFGTRADDVGPAEARANLALGGAETPAGVVAANQLGGVLYLGTNVTSVTQVAELSAGLQAAAPDGIGLLIGVDQEGGRVNRVTEGVTVFQSARSLSGDADAVRDAAETTASQLSALGFNVVLAPVADLTDGGGVIGDRSYSADPEVAAQMVAASIDGLGQGGVAAAVKHWPGHGATNVDSHKTLPVIDVDLDTWTGRERVPFDAAIAQGVDIVLVGHLSFPGLDSSGDPATVSSIMLDGLLRADLGFEGIIMTDALDMGAVKSNDRGALVVDAVLAGVDILLVPPDLSAARIGLLDALDDGRLSPERLDQSVERILRLKERLGLLDGDL